MPDDESREFGFRVWWCHRGTGWSLASDEVYSEREWAEESPEYTSEAQYNYAYAVDVLPGNLRKEANGAIVPEPNPPNKPAWAKITVEVKDPDKLEKLLHALTEGNETSAKKLRESIGETPRIQLTINQNLKVVGGCFLPVHKSDGGS